MRLSVLALLCFATSAAANSPKNEIIAHYRSFAPDAGGFQAIGGNVRFNRFLLSAHLLSSSVEFSALYVYRPDAGALEPRFGFGAGYFYTLSLIASAGVTWHLFGHFGLALDQWVYVWPANSFQMMPWTILGLSYAFG